VPATPPQPFGLAQRVSAEAVGTALLLAAVVGSGISDSPEGTSPWRSSRIPWRRVRRSSR
jgi:hypothetical protein